MAITRKEQIHRMTMEVFHRLCPGWEGTVMLFAMRPEAAVGTRDQEHAPAKTEYFQFVLHAEAIYDAIKKQVEKEVYAQL